MPEVTLLSSLLLGFIMGIRHALDADHVVAITTIISRSKSIRQSAMAGLSWGIGHSLTLLVAGSAVLFFKLNIPAKLALSLEFAVGIVLVWLGVPLVKRLLTHGRHVHWHEHGDKSHLHGHSHATTPEHQHAHISRRSLLVGMVHGFAGSGAITMLVLGSMSSVSEGVFFLLLFGVGTLLGMLLFSGVISLPFKFTSRMSSKANLWFQGASGLFSIALGVIIMWQIAFATSLFSAS